MPEPSPPSTQASSSRSMGMGMRLVSHLGASTLALLAYVGGATNLMLEALGWLWRGVASRRTRLGRQAIYGQLVRLGVRATGVVCLVSACIGLILTLQMAPPLDEFGQVDRVPNIIAIAVFRELGPLITAIVLTGFAGASISAELGTMVVGEEIEALRAHALNPVRFLVVPRILATALATVVLCVIGELTAMTAGWWIGLTFLDIPSGVFIDNVITQLSLSDYLTGLAKAGFFGLLVGLIACYNGLRVAGGAAGVGRATTYTVVHSIVAIIFSDFIFTAIFYRVGWT